MKNCFKKEFCNFLKSVHILAWKVKKQLPFSCMESDVDAQGGMKERMLEAETGRD